MRSGGSDAHGSRQFLKDAEGDLALLGARLTRDLQTLDDHGVPVQGGLQIARESLSKLGDISVDATDHSAAHWGRAAEGLELSLNGVRCLIDALEQTRMDSEWVGELARSRNAQNRGELAQRQASARAVAVAQRVTNAVESAATNAAAASLAVERAQAQLAEAEAATTTASPPRDLAAGWAYECLAIASGHVSEADARHRRAHLLANDAEDAIQDLVQELELIGTGVESACGADGSAEGGVSTPTRRARGHTSGRPFDPSAAGGPVRPGRAADVHIDASGVGAVEDHLRRFVPEGQHLARPEQGMLERLKLIVSGQLRPTQYDLNFYAHERDEANRYRALGYDGKSYLGGIDLYDLWNNVHTAALEDYRASDADLFLPELLP